MFRLFTQSVDDLAHQVDQIDTFEIETEQAGADAGDVEQLAGQALELVHLLERGADLGRLRHQGGPRSVHVALDRLQAQLHRGDRRAELVRGDRQKLFAGADRRLCGDVQERVRDREARSAGDVDRQLQRIRVVLAGLEL